MSSVLAILLDVKMRSNLFLKFFSDDLARSHSDRATHKIDDAGSAVRTAGHLQHADCDVESCAGAAGRSVALLCSPGVWLQVIQDRVEGEFTFVDWDEEASERV